MEDELLEEEDLYDDEYSWAETDDEPQPLDFPQGYYFGMLDDLIIMS